MKKILSSLLIVFFFQAGFAQSQTDSFANES